MGTMTLKINSLEVRKSQTKGDYAYAKGVQVLKDGSLGEERTIMSFGPQFASVRRFMRSGRKIVVQAVFDKGTIKVLGPQKVAAKTA